MRKCFLAFVFFLILPSRAFALASPWQQDEDIAVRLISGVSAVGEADTVPLGLEIKLADGRHTYWRFPGQAGLPPQFDWSRSQSDDANFQSAKIFYPAPRRYVLYGLETVGYREHVILPIDATLRRKGTSLQALPVVDLLICSSICLPKHFEMELTIPSGAAASDTESELLQRARAQMPSSPEESGVLLKSVSTDGKNVSVTIATRNPLDQPDVFIENDKNIGFSGPQIEIEGAGYGASLKVEPVDTLPEGVSLSSLPLTLTIINGNEAVEIKGVRPAPVDNAASAAGPKADTKIALLFAFIGGLILNFMPCVLPVLSLKVLSAVRHGGGEARKVRASFLVTAAGIVFSFLVLAVAMMVLRKLELSLGWGVQFQQPAFLMFLVLLLTFFAANLWGLFDIALPRFLMDRIDDGYRPTLGGDFASGAFATLLATPCSAPFLGTAVGFALGSGFKEIFAVFLLLGLGMAVPYLMVAAFPRVATAFPKPGAWMIVLRFLLGCALVLTALWLVWVMAAQITASSAAAFAMLMVALILLMALKKRGVSPRLTVAGLGIVCLSALVMGLVGEMQPKAPAQMDRAWMQYSAASLRADLAEGKTVFLDVTADWCLTCKANKVLTLSDKRIVERLFHTDVIAMQANWTNPDPRVSELLHQYGRYGIPFNVVFGPRAPQGILLPELLTPSMVLDALDRAAESPDAEPKS